METFISKNMKMPGIWREECREIDGQQQILQRNVGVSEIAIWQRNFAHRWVSGWNRNSRYRFTEGGQLGDGGACATI